MSMKQWILEALNAYLTGTTLPWSDKYSLEEWSAFFRLSSHQRILPMVFQAVYNCPAMAATGAPLIPALRQEIMHSVMLQTRQSSEFLALYRKLTEAGLKPLVVKGIVCRSLYPDPDFRASGDEDVYLQRQEYPACHEIFLSEGMELVEPDRDIWEEGEVPYGKKGSPLYIELHKELFSVDSEAYGELNEFFDGCWDRAVQHEIDGVKVWSMGHTDHFLYLICHSFKHFIHSGFGIRQVCDIVMYAKTFGREIDWTYVLDCCRRIRADLFAAALMQIGFRYLSLDPEDCGITREWLELEADPEAILEDLLSGGVFGATDLTRQHSSTITLNAVAADRRGEVARAGILRSLFPPRKNLVNRYPWLRKLPFLLPVAWGLRILTYGWRSRGRKDDNTRETLRIGQERVELLRKYGVIR